MSQQINLFNPVFLKQKRYFSALTMAQAIALVAAGCVALYGYARYQTVALDELSARTNRQAEERSGQLVKLSNEFSNQGHSKLLEEEVGRAEALLKRRQQLLEDMLRGSADTAGFTRYLEALARQTMQGVWLTGVTIGGKGGSVVISGRGLEGDLVPAYIRLLKRETPFAGQSVSDLRVSSKAALDKPRAAGVPVAEAVPAQPARYVEFSVSIPLQAAPGPVGRGPS